MKILIIGPNSVENKLLVKAAKANKHHVDRVSIKELFFTLVSDHFKISYKGTDIADYDVCLIRGINPFFAQAKTVAKYLHRKKRKVIDRELYRKVYTFNKMFMYSALNHHGLPNIDTYYFPTDKAYRQAKVKFTFPIIIKDIKGMHGRNIFFAKNQKEFNTFFTKHKINQFFVQTLIESDYYERVLVVGGKVLGAMRRYTLKYLEDKDVPVTKRSFAAEMTKEKREIAINAAKATNSDIAGVDLIYDKQGHPYILEVNRSPNFKRFTQVMKIDVAQEIIEYLEKINKE